MDMPTASPLINHVPTVLTDRLVTNTDPRKLKSQLVDLSGEMDHGRHQLTRQELLTTWLTKVVAFARVSNTVGRGLQ
jgi:hypothetical protein